MTEASHTPARRSRAQARLGSGCDTDVIAITADGKAAYVSNKGSGTVTPIDIGTNTPGPPIPVGSSPGPIAIAP